MATTVVWVDPLSPASIEHAERHLRERERAFERNTARFFVELAEIGRQAAAGAYGPAISVELQPLDDGVSIVANGRAIAFLEFGAGDTVNSGNRYANMMPFDVQSGSWSREHARQYIRYGYWEFGGVRYTAVAPRNGMEHAYEEIMQSIYRVAREVFGT